ncbi:hypothetical protein Bbelb_209150 [Branchiostoma belcheri]|nr:hypothetical protein Bbelb_209150 [Branchiostoma belcheri]
MSVPLRRDGLGSAAAAPERPGHLASPSRTFLGRTCACLDRFSTNVITSSQLHYHRSPRPDVFDPAKSGIFKPTSARHGNLFCRPGHLMISLIGKPSLCPTSSDPRCCPEQAAEESKMFKLAVVLLMGLVCAANAKTYGRCELARELVSRGLTSRSQAGDSSSASGAPCLEIQNSALFRTMLRFGAGQSKRIQNRVCLVEHESGYRTGVRGGPNWDGSYDHGIFQINDYYWCDDGGPHNDCGVSCSNLRDSNIADDVRCAKLIYQRHGFSAWSVHSSVVSVTSMGGSTTARATTTPISPAAASKHHVTVGAESFVRHDDVRLTPAHVTAIPSDSRCFGTG